MKSKVLVIGGTGMISGPVTRAVASRGHQVSIFHRGTTKPHADLPADVAEIFGDRSDTSGFISTLRDSGPWDCVIDMIGGTETDAAVLAESPSGRVGHVIACSTTSVYSRPFAQMPVSEDAACEPTFPYGQNKVAYEKRLRAAEAQGSFAVTIIRPGHTYDRAGAIIHSLGRRTSHLDRLIHRRPIVVHDDGQGLWSMAWADDVAEAFAAAIGNDQAKGKTYHVTGSDHFSWNEYHGAIAMALNAPAPDIVHIPSLDLGRILPERTQQCLRTLRFPGVYDCSAARQALGYAPKMGFREGLKRNVDCLRSRNLIESWETDMEYEQLVATCLATQR